MDKFGTYNGTRTYFQSVSNANFIGRVNVFDLSALTEPIGNEKNPQVRNVKHLTNRVNIDGLYYTIKS